MYVHIICIGRVSEASSDTTIDSDGATSEELKELKGKSFQRRFQSVECGVRNVVFIQCEEASICTSDLIHYMLSNIKTSDIPSTRYKYVLNAMYRMKINFQYVMSNQLYG